MNEAQVNGLNLIQWANGNRASLLEASQVNQRRE